MTAAKKKRPQPKGGSRKGRPNKATANLREAVNAFVEHNMARAQELFDRVARKNPAMALRLIVDLADFCLPRLQRTEFQGQVASVALTAPVTSAEQAARVYAELMGGAPIDLNSVVIEVPPQPIAAPTASPAVLEHTQAEAQGPSAIPESTSADATTSTSAASPLDAPSRDSASVAERWARLGKPS